VSSGKYGIDQLGLYEDEIDDLLADHTGQRLYALGAINEGARWASIGLQTALGIASSLLPGSGLYDAFQSVQVIASGRGGFWEAVNIATAAFPLVKGAAIGIKSLSRARRYGAKACNCFVAGTTVQTIDGPRVIESIRIGDLVVTSPEDDASAEPTIGTVTSVFRAVSPQILWITLSTGTGVGVTEQHEIWMKGRGWIPAGHLQVGDRLRSLEDTDVSVTQILADTEASYVYNLEVEGTFTYYAAGIWVHNNSCRQLLLHRHHVIPRFMGGLDKATAFLDEKLHSMYHTGLNRALRNAGIPLPYRGKWHEFFESNVEYAEKALDVLVDYTRRFDGENGTGLTRHVLRELQ
jgi:hypothetical protein